MRAQAQDAQTPGHAWEIQNLALNREGLGIAITSVGIELIRPLNTTRLGWDQIEAFELVTPRNTVDRGSRRIRVRRMRSRVPRQRVQMPTVWITTDAALPPLRGPSRLRWSGGEVEDVLGFLNQELAARR